MALRPSPPRRLLAGSAFALAAMLLLAACGPSTADEVARLRPGAEAVFQRIAALAPAVRDTAPVTSDGFDLRGAAIRLDGADSNALLVPAAYVDAPQSTRADGTGTSHALALQICANAVRDENTDPPPGAPLFVAECARAEYVFVLRPHHETAPVITGDGFEGGGFDGDVLLFRLADGALLGGFRVRAGNSDTVQIRTDERGNPIDALERLQSDLSSNVYVTVDDGLRELIPGVLPERG